MKFAFGYIVVFLCAVFTFPVASKNTTDKIPLKLVRQLIKDINTNENKFRLTREDLKVLNEHLKYELHDLNGDSRPEFFLYIRHSDWCGAGSNCSYWVYQRVAGGYKLLLDDKVLRVKDTITNGYKDLESQSPMGLCDVNVQRTNVALYKFDGRQYQFISHKEECIPFTPKNSKDSSHAISNNSFNRTMS